MTKKFVVLFIMLLLPVMIWAQNSVTFDFSSSSQEVQNTIEKDGITLKFSDLLGKPITPTFITIKNNDFIKLNFDRLLTVESKDCLITSVVFVISDVNHLLKLYNKEKTNFLVPKSVLVGTSFINSHGMKKLRKWLLPLLPHELHILNQ